MVTKKEIAEYLGISRTAVSLVLNNTPSSTISAETRTRILQAAKELGYRDVEVSPKLCYVLYNRESNDPRYMGNLKVMEEEASQLNYGLVFMNITSAEDSLNKLQRLLDNQEIEGFIVSGDVDKTLIDMFRQSQAPYIIEGLPLPDIIDNVNFAANDDRRLAYDATSYLISIGHTRIALFMGSLDYYTHRLGMEGYCQALEDNGLPVDKSLIQISNEENGYELCKRAEILQVDYTAAFCANTVIQFGVLQRLKETGTAVPQSISLIGSGLNELARVSVPQLTTLYASTAETAKTVSLLIDIIHTRVPYGNSCLFTKFERFEGGTAAPRKTKH
ncbi:LacI family DNA-binding transcriptional regulator [Paenibacillus spongiae]|uniref:LacI family transcriptional regulator n=1 Tax=Paenibacillus spongiae TaxID=2909671 RepID=A0ABY5S9S4_9BACL|nr:LacI family DNA-binding transcriptional regulator [Paenibacillus spongiae]UVI30404.1 LacI family transcriptional regulator [Paenibacillus spongiae]